MHARRLWGERIDVMLVAPRAQGMQQDVSQYGSREKVDGTHPSQVLRREALALKAHVAV